MKELRAILLVFLLVFASCSDNIMDIPEDFTPRTLISGKIGNYVEYSLKVAPPRELRYSSEIFLPVKSDADLSFVLKVYLTRQIGALEDGQYLPGIDANLYIKNGDSWVKYRFFPYETEDGFEYVTQVVLPSESNTYKMRLEIGGMDVEPGKSLLLLLRDASFVTGTSFVKDFTFNRADLF